MGSERRPIASFVCLMMTAVRIPPECRGRAHQRGAVTPAEVARLLLVVAIIVVLVNVIQGRKVL